MGEEYLKEVEREVEGLRYVCSKIIQAYRIRMKLFLRRYELLTAIDRNFDNISNNPNFYSQLDNTLKNEKKLLQIIEGDEKKVGNNLTYALTRLERYNRELGGELNDTYLRGWATKLSGRDIGIFLGRMISFLKKMEHDLKVIEKRMDVEDIFIRERTPEQFNKFIKVWEEEMKAHEKMIKDFKRALNASRRIVHSGKREGGAIIVGGALGGVTAAIGGIALKTTAGAVVGGAVGVSIVMIGFMMYLTSILKTGLQYVYKEEELIRDFEEKRGMEKHPFWHKLFSSV